MLERDSIMEISLAKMGVNNILRMHYSMWSIVRIYSTWWHTCVHSELFCMALNIHVNKGYLSNAEKLVPDCGGFAASPTLQIRNTFIKYG